MFSVIFEVHPKSSQWPAYLALGRMLKPELEQIDGFVENVRYGSLTRKDWLVSLSQWRDEKTLVRWRTRANHHAVQQTGRDEVFGDYHLRVGQLTQDSLLPAGQELREQRLDETATGEATTVVMISASRSSDWVEATSAGDVAEWLGLDIRADGLVAWDVFDAVLTPGDIILLMSWRDKAAADKFQAGVILKEDARLRSVRIVRDYGMFDRREAPQFYPDANGAPTIHT